MKSERILTAIISLCTFVLFIYACGFDATISYDVVGPKAFPILLMGLICASALYLTLRPTVFFERIELGWDKPMVIKLALCAVAMTLYAALFEWLGFIIATALMTMMLGRLFNGKTIPTAVTALLLSGTMYYLFDQFLYVQLPQGLLG